MEPLRFDFEQVFDQNYLFFYEPGLTEERTEREVELTWRLLNLHPGLRILDLACGHGRIANRLAVRGCHMVGLDASLYFLDLARRDADARGLAVEYFPGDMRQLPWSEAFDNVINWFTSFGYFTPAENQQVLREVYRALRPGGAFLLELQNRDRILREFQPVTVVERAGDFLIDRSRYDAMTGYVATERISIRNSKVRRMQFVVRLFTYPELHDWLSGAGFVDVRGFDDQGEAYTLAARRMVVTARKP